MSGYRRRPGRAVLGEGGASRGAARRRVGRLLAGGAAVLTALPILVACSGPADRAVVRVPEDVATISEAVAAVQEDGLVLVGPGVYREEVLVETPGVTIRGLDRNDTVVDADGKRPYGIVGVADGITIENLTVTGATFYGVLITGMHSDEAGPTARGSSDYTSLDPDEFPPLQRFLVDRVTAYNNGLYGIYAFDANNGVIRNSYASGSADSGFYVGQCRECNILVENNRAADNAVGFENANASDSVWVIGNDFSGNRIGMTFLSNYQEAFAPQRENWVAGNIVTDNVSSESPSHAQGGWGIGIGLSGASENSFERNLIAGNPTAGVLLDSAEDLAAAGNAFLQNRFERNGTDIVNASSDRASASGNCVDGSVTALPSDLIERCSGMQPAVSKSEFPWPEAPDGTSYLRVPKPDPQESKLVSERSPEPLPRQITRPDPSTVRLPSLSTAGTR
ncbi:right-handed parallel beta-helix repeat-containing protein [Leucobacter chromiireducens]|uniref:Plasmid stabilization protein n=1 Tax=Leucobacter chromiireducens subsp. solipictus TaxID=398235 RepID=A0ABS1SDB5_9MICO|nr:right-handed parallel beta-helix repeat-containing protein [Leucobacter chromiireducens]MBL3678534.1 plasmid stabilization protein [Leucobacter chromiireducens subsp. solipictus]